MIVPFSLVLFLADAADVKAGLCDNFRHFARMLKGPSPHTLSLEKNMIRAFAMRGHDVKAVVGYRIPAYGDDYSTALYNTALEKVARALKETAITTPEEFMINIKEVRFIDEGRTAVRFFRAPPRSLFEELILPRFLPRQWTLFIPFSIPEEDIVPDIAVAFLIRHIISSLERELPPAYAYSTAGKDPYRFIVTEDEGLALGDFRGALEEISPIVSSFFSFFKQYSSTGYHEAFKRFRDLTIKVVGPNKTWEFTSSGSRLTLFIPSDVKFSPQSVEEMAGLLSKAASSPFIRPRRYRDPYRFIVTGEEGLPLRDYRW